MKAIEVNLLDFFQQPLQMIVPDPHRSYRWTEKECQQLWDDIVRVAENESVTSYFIGTIVYIEYGILRRTVVPRLVLLDGQQRLATISLLLAALGKADNTGQAGKGHKEINDFFLFNSQEKGEFYCKLVPAQGDRDTFFGLIRGEELTPSDSNKMIKNYRYFENKINECSIDTNLLYKGIAKLTIMDISTDRAYENPQSVCESLDSTGLDETQTSLIRNWLGFLRSAS